MIFLDGLPETQAELVQQVAVWLESQGKGGTTDMIQH
jgi:hypothetical protein